MTIKKDKITKASLTQKAKELAAQLVHNYYFASKEIDKAGVDRMMGSGVILELTAIGGRELIDPVVIKDGLSPETITAIKADLLRSYDSITEFNPHNEKLK